MELRTRDLAIGFDGQAPVVANADLHVGPGRMVGLIGPNGSGKTTLLRTLVGLLPPLAGEVRYDGVTRDDIGKRDLARRLAYLAQGGEVNWDLTAGALVALGRLPHRRPFAGGSGADRAAVARALAVTGAEGFRDRVVGTLSGGERMRVLLARALAVEAEILLADEPVAALDPQHQLVAMSLFRGIARAGAAVVVVLHDLALASRFCDRLILLGDGRVLADGSPGEVLTDPLLATAFRVEVARGERDGMPFLVPWRTLDQT